MDAELSSLDASMTSLMSDCYLASNESSRPGTPPTELEKNSNDFEESDDEEEDSGNEETTDLAETETTIMDKMTPQAVTPSSTPADGEPGSTGQYCPPQLNPTALMAALQHAASFQKPKSLTSTLQPVPGRNLNVTGPLHMSQSANIMDNFNLDMCFVGDAELDELD